MGTMHATPTGGGRTKRAGRRAKSAESDAPPRPAAAFAPPPTVGDAVFRAQLVRRLSSETSERAVLVQAPAGYGKTTTLAQWVDHDGRAFAWVDAARCGNDHARFGERLLGALGYLLRLLAPPGRSTRAPSTPAAQAIIAAADEVAAHGAAVLVIDDVHRLQSQRSQELLEALLREAPPALRIALGSRAEPTLGLCRLRAAGELLSLDARDLCMNVYESQTLLRTLGVALDTEATLQLVERSEGWPAGIHLTAIAALASQNGHAEPLPLEVTHHTVAQYIREEILQSLAPDARALLVRTAILDQLSGPLCDAVAETTGAGVTLRQLAADGMMLAPLDPARVWFRCHTMLRDVLRSELEVSEHAAIRPLHARASSWYERMGEVDDALEHSFAAHDTAVAAATLWRNAPRYLYGRDTLVQRWLSELTPEEVGACPGLGLAAAHSQLALGDAASARHWGQVAADSLAPGEDRVLWCAARLIDLATGSCDGAKTAAAATQAAVDSGGEAGMRPLALLVAGVALALQGQREAARMPLLEATEACVSSMPWVAALASTELALDDVADREWARAGDRVEEALTTLRAHGLDMLQSAALPHAVAALVASSTGAADQAKEHALLAARQLDSLGRHLVWYEVQARVALARTCTRLADIGAARSLLAQASRRARGPHSVPLFVTWLDDAWSEIDDVGAAALNGPGSLTMAELRVLRFLPSHLSFREIGERLHVSPNTVKSQAHATYAKLGAGSRTEAVAHAAALGLVDAPIC